MSEDLHLADMARRTHEGYLRAVRTLADFLNKGIELRLDANRTVLAMSEPAGHSSGPAMRPREVKA